MSITPQDLGPTHEQLTKALKAPAENKFVEAKGAMAWDGGNDSASVAKDIAAFANSKRGGFIIIGKAHADDGGWDYRGLSSDQAATFDTTKVAQWVNSYFAPPIHLTCNPLTHEGNRFVIIHVRQFSGVPSLCIKTFSQIGQPGKHLLKEGAIYARNQNAESKLVTTVDEWRTLIDLVTGNGTVPEVDPFQQEIDRVRRDLDLNSKQPGWWMSFRPAQHTGDRWKTKEELQRLIVAHAIRKIEEFPFQFKGTVGMGWGIANELFSTWALTKTGMFCVAKEFPENHMEAKRAGYRGGDGSVPPGQWLEFLWVIRDVVRFFKFQSRFMETFSPGTDIRITLDAGPLAGRKLIVHEYGLNLGYGAPEPCRASIYEFDRVVDSETLRTGWEPTCVDALKDFMDLFPNHFYSQLDSLSGRPDCLSAWVERSKQEV